MGMDRVRSVCTASSPAQRLLAPTHQPPIMPHNHCRSRETIIAAAIQAQAGGDRAAAARPEVLRISRGMQRAIGKERGIGFAGARAPAGGAKAATRPFPLGCRPQHGDRSSFPRPSATGSNMITTPQGAERHYTLSYSDFCRRLQEEPSFSCWFEQVRHAAGGALPAVCSLACCLCVGSCSGCPAPWRLPVLHQPPGLTHGAAGCSVP